MIGNNSKNKITGFTLIELLVAMFIFGIVMTAMSSVFIESLKVQRKALNFQQVEENSRFILEAISKEIRVSTISSVGDSCITTLSMVHPTQGAISYGVSGGVLQKTLASGSTVSVSSNTIEFTRLDFCFTGALLADQKQPRVTIIAGIKSKKTKEQVNVDIQTTISLRFLTD